MHYYVCELGYLWWGPHYSSVYSPKGPYSIRCYHRFDGIDRGGDPMWTLIGDKGGEERDQWWPSWETMEQVEQAQAGKIIGLYQYEAKARKAHP